MSVTATVPNGSFPVYSPIQVQFAISDVGDGISTIKRIGYQLKLSDGTVITPIEMITLPSAGTVVIDIWRDLVPFVYTAVPNIGGGWVARNASEMMATVKVWYCEYVTDLVECLTTGNLEAHASEIKVFNTALQPYEPSLASPYSLTHQPLSTWQWRNAVNYMCFIGNVSPTMVTQGDTISSSTPYDINMTAFSLHGLGVSDEATTAYIKYTATALSKTWTVHLRDNCVKGLEFANIMFLDPLGGRNCMSFEIIESREVQTSYDIAEKLFPSSITSPTGTSHTRSTIGNATIINKRVATKLTLTRDAPDTPDHREWFKAFLASAGYHIQLDVGGTPVWHKFIVESGSTSYGESDDEIDFNVTGYMVPLYNTHITDI